jgi:predicted O-methyltransferase YrrM
MPADVKGRAASILEDLQRRTVIAEDDRVTALDPQKTLCLLELGLTREPARVLEIGLGWGFSAAAIQSLGCVRRHVIIEVEAGSPRAIQGERNVRAMTTRPKSLELFWGDSHSVLPRLCDSSEQFDLVFIDGGHRYDDVFVDFHFSRRLVVAGAGVVLDDTSLPSVRTVVSWVETNLADQWRRLVTPGNLSLAAFEALAASDQRNWDHFIPFVNGMAHRPRNGLSDERTFPQEDS